MLMCHPLVLASMFVRFITLTILGHHEHPSYLAITAVDAGIHATHLAAYAGFSRSGLQLPVGAFLPSPEPLTTTDMVFYATPAAITTWRLGVGVFEAAAECIKYVPEFTIGAQIVALRTFHTLVQQHKNYARLLVHTRSALTLASEGAAELYKRSSRDKSYRLSPHLSAPGIQGATLSPPSTSRTLYFITFGSSSLDLRAPMSAAVGLGQCTPYNVLPIQDDTILLDAEFSDASHRLNESAQDRMEDSKEDTEYVANPWDVSQRTPTGSLVIVIHVRTCLMMVLHAGLNIFIGYFILRVVPRMIRRAYGRMRALVASIREVVQWTSETVLISVVDICGHPQRLFRVALAFHMARAKNSATNLTPTFPDAANPPASSTPPTPFACFLPNVQPQSVFQTMDAKGYEMKADGKARVRMYQPPVSPTIEDGNLPGSFIPVVPDIPPPSVNEQAENDSGEWKEVVHRKPRRAPAAPVAALSNPRSKSKGGVKRGGKGAGVKKL